MQIAQRLGSQQCTWTGKDSHPPSVSLIHPGSLPKCPAQRQDGGCLCFQMWPAEGTRTAAQPHG